ncbi:MAG TPA: PqiC family protein [Candidatus Kryptonia bacterium]|nr:PqiC family protein [Candidatus Kryptonia bacterium]
MRTVAIRLVSLVLMATAVASTGCSILAPQRDVSRFYTLAVLPEAQAAAPGRAHAASGPIYGLGPITLPAYLDRNEIATRVSPTELTYADNDRWAERLEANATRVLLQNLSSLLATERIVTFPWPLDVPVDYQIEVTVLRFERTAAGEATLSARWRIKDVRKGKTVRFNESDFTQPGAGTTADSVTALSAALGDLSREIAAALQEGGRKK